ncbi:MAG: hypothetical protein WCG36_02225, partial [bacterium]
GSAKYFRKYFRATPARNIWRGFGDKFRWGAVVMDGDGAKTANWAVWNIVGAIGVWSVMWRRKSLSGKG